METDRREVADQGLRFPQEISKRYQVIPIDEEQGEQEQRILCQRPLNDEEKREIASFFPAFRTVFIEDKRSNIHKRREEYYNICTETAEYAETFRRVCDSGSAQELLDFCLESAISLNASDIHLMAERHNFYVKLRIDGILRTLLRLRSGPGEQLIRYIKVRAQMDIGRTLLPMEGRFAGSAGGEHLDVRVSIMPTVSGEKISLRILGVHRNLFHLDELGFSDQELALLQEHIHRACGLILVTGPTGCGKSTTLQAILREINDGRRNIISMEDPVEYHLEGITQVSLTKESRVDFSDILKFALRQDPDVIMIGEIRDGATADTGLKAALTGHLVLTSLHTKTALGAVERLKDLGIDDYVIADSLSLIINQRLIRMLCPRCKEVRAMEERERILLGEGGGHSLCHPGGCPSCFGTGYFGRQAVFEVLDIRQELRSLIKNASVQEQEPGQVSQRERPARPSLQEKLKSMVMEGKTSIDEYTKYF